MDEILPTSRSKRDRKVRGLVLEIPADLPEADGHSHQPLHLSVLSTVKRIPTYRTFGWSAVERMRNKEWLSSVVVATQLLLRRNVELQVLKK